MLINQAITGYILKSGDVFVKPLKFALITCYKSSFLENVPQEPFKRLVFKIDVSFSSQLIFLNV